MAYFDFQQMVNDLTRDDAAKISAAQLETAIATAVARYSKDRPRQKVEDIIADGGNFVDLPAAWEADFSQLVSLEYPVGRVPPSFISAQSFSLYASPTGLQIMLSVAVPADATLRSTYTIQHQINDQADTVPLGDREAVCCFAAANLCDQLAALYSGDTDSTIQADSVNHQSKAAEFAARAKALRKRYLDELGIDAKKNVAAGVVVDLDLSNSQGRERLTHRRGYR